jgi:hypothetical protein
VNIRRTFWLSRCVRSQVLMIFDPDATLQTQKRFPCSGPCDYTGPRWPPGEPLSAIGPPLVRGQWRAEPAPHPLPGRRLRHAKGVLSARRNLPSIRLGQVAFSAHFR